MDLSYTYKCTICIGQICHLSHLIVTFITRPERNSGVYWVFEVSYTSPEMVSYNSGWCRSYLVK